MHKNQLHIQGKLVQINNVKTYENNISGYLFCSLNIINEPASYGIYCKMFLTILQYKYTLQFMFLILNINVENV